MGIESNMIERMTSSEINSYIMGDVEPNEPVKMSHSVAMAILDHPCYDSLSYHLLEWAWNTIDEVA